MIGFAALLEVVTGSGAGRVGPLAEPVPRVGDSAAAVDAGRFGAPGSDALADAAAVSLNRGGLSGPLLSAERASGRALGFNSLGCAGICPSRSGWALSTIGSVSGLAFASRTGGWVRGGEVSARRFAYRSSGVNVRGAGGVALAAGNSSCWAKSTAKCDFDEGFDLAGACSSLRACVLAVDAALAEALVAGESLAGFSGDSDFGVDAGQPDNATKPAAESKSDVQNRKVRRRDIKGSNSGFDTQGLGVVK